MTQKISHTWLHRFVKKNEDSIQLTRLRPINIHAVKDTAISLKAMAGPLRKNIRACFVFGRGLTPLYNFLSTRQETSPTGFLAPAESLFSIESSWTPETQPYGALYTAPFGIISGVQVGLRYIWRLEQVPITSLSLLKRFSAVNINFLRQLSITLNIL